MEQSRSHFRVEYPSHERPKLIADSQSFAVVNVSEEGLLFEFTGPAEDLEVESQFEGTIHFRDEAKVQVSGTVLRVEGNTVAVHLIKGVPLSRIMAEQRYLINKFGTIKVPQVV
jgi:hypothetical protein